MVRLNRIYTKAGDGGETRLVGGQKVAKDSTRIETYGTVDELSSCLGLARAALATAPVPAGAAELSEVIKRIQNELFNLGSDLATLPQDRHPKQPLIEARHVTALEQEIDAWNESIPPLRSFVLPGGGWVASTLHLARTLCRRAERLVVILRATETVGDQVLPYLNRLSDALFVMSRHASRLYAEPEPLWEPETT
ncbi:MAG TPA: cob(I)yrinic acid a,c-diamide adenosyltransferase [Polyangia bacterium]|nr:cob(I)yrinic acid a,c-diamide adenosyltransferase [Polyangia bacterium]